jgi:enoyl-CoA hydratase
MSDELLVHQDGRVLRVQFNRPSDNGVSDSMAAALSALVLQAHEQADLVVLSSIGPDFCTGRVRDVSFPAASEA